MKQACYAVVLGLLIMGCSLTRLSEKEKATPPSTLPVQIMTATVPVQDAGWLLDTACYEALAALHNQTAVLGDVSALESFYNTLDSHCKEPIQRQSFNFANQLLVVAVMAGRGCNAQLIPKGMENNSLTLQFIQSGDCPYDVIATYTGIVTKPSSGEFKVTVTGA